MKKGSSPLRKGKQGYGWKETEERAGAEKGEEKKEEIKVMYTAICY